MKGELRLVASGKCKGCPEMDLDLDLHRIYAYDEVAEVALVCNHAERCDRLERWLRAKMAEEEAHDQV